MDEEPKLDFHRKQDNFTWLEKSPTKKLGPEVIIFRVLRSAFLFAFSQHSMVLAPILNRNGGAGGGFISLSLCLILFTFTAISAVFKIILFVVHLGFTVYI